MSFTSLEKVQAARLVRSPNSQMYPHRHQPGGLSEIALSRRDITKIARRFNAGNAVEESEVPQGRLTEAA